MLDRGAPTSQRAIAELADARTRENLLRYAVWRTKDVQDGKDLLHEAIVWVLDPDRKPWVKPDVTFLRHMRSVMDDVAIANARRAHRRLEINETKLIAQTGDEEAFPDPWDGCPWSDEQLDDRRLTGLLRQLWARIEPHFRTTDPLCVRIYEAACKEHETPAEQAEYLGVPVEEVYEALRRLKYRAEVAMAEWRKEEAQRMFEARQRARKGGGAQ